MLVERHDSEFLTSVYRKPTFTGQYLRWNSFSPQKRKINLIGTLVHRAFMICSKSKLDQELGKITNTSKSDFITRFGDILQKINSTNLETFIVGDFNIDTLCSNFNQLSSSSKDYLLSISSNGFSQLIDIPTRVSTSSQTLIDHIITNVSDKNLIPGLICSDISDHYPTFVIASNTTKANNNKPIFRRNMKKFNSENFKKDLFKTLLPFYNCSKLLTTENFDSLVVYNKNFGVILR